MSRSNALLLAAAGTLVLNACATDNASYPSLARRPVERVSGTAPAVAPAPVPAPEGPDPERTSTLDRLTAQARNADARFRTNTPHARSLIAAATGAAIASESWSIATIALADLESQRSQAMIALADLDALYAATVVARRDASTIAAARLQVVAIVAAEDAVLAGLKDGLRS